MFKWRMIPEASEVLESRGAKMDAEADLAPEIADAEPPEAATAAATTVIVCVLTTFTGMGSAWSMKVSNWQSFAHQAAVPGRRSTS